MKTPNPDNPDSNEEQQNTPTNTEEVISYKSHTYPQRLKNCTPDKKCHFTFQGTFCSPLRTLQENMRHKTDLQMMSTPTGSSKRNSFILNNPFEVEVDSLSMSSFSPSVFKVTQKKTEEDGSFRWSIEQLALLEPVDIDETSNQNTCFDKDKEIKAQEAIDIYFSKNSIVPSPWTPTVKYISSQNIKSNGSNVKVAKILQKQSSAETALHANEVSTQTALTIPPSLDLMSLLGHFYTYYDNAVDVAFNSSYNDVDMLSTSSLRRKLFMNEDNSERPALPIEKKNVINCETPNTKSQFTYPTPSSDHFSSSPITPRNWSLSANHISMTSPNVSPICASSRKSSFNLRLNAEKENQHDSKPKKFSSTLNKFSPDELKDIRPGLDMISEIDADTSWDMSKNDNFIQQDICDVPTFPTTDLSSNQPDTGYLTGSINSMVQQTSSDTQYRATPVAELLEDCAISKFPVNYVECLKLPDEEKDDSAMVISQDQSSVEAQLRSETWNPGVFSTPTVNSLNFIPNNF